jgi:hypothetical protein
MTKRIYAIRIRPNGDKNARFDLEAPPRLVRSNSLAQAIRHVAQSTHSGRVATQDDIVAALTNNPRTAIEEAGQEDSNDDPSE